MYFTPNTINFGRTGESCLIIFMGKSLAFPFCKLAIILEISSVVQSAMNIDFKFLLGINSRNEGMASMFSSPVRL